MMIAHASLPADDTKTAAAVLAEIMQGEIVRFPPGGPNAYMAWSGDGQTELEIVQRGAVIKNTPGTDLTQDIVNELNTLVPSVSITPPANWQPGQNRPGAQQPAAPAPAQQPQGR